MLRNRNDITEAEELRAKQVIRENDTIPRRREGLYEITLKGRTTHEVTSVGTSPYSYKYAQIEAVMSAVDKGTQHDKEQQKKCTNVLPYDLSFKHPSARPHFNEKIIPPTNPDLTEIADEVFDENDKRTVEGSGWCMEAGNPWGARDMLRVGASVLPCLQDRPFTLLDEDDDSDIPESFSEEIYLDEGMAFVHGQMHSNFKHSIDDEGKVKLFDIPATASDPAFRINIESVEPPKGKTNDFNMNPDRGVNATKNRPAIMHTTATYLDQKCKWACRHYRRFVSAQNRAPTMHEAFGLIKQAMQDKNASAAIFAAFSVFLKLEWFDKEQILEGKATRLIWAPGQIEAILGKMLMKPVNLASFKRFERGMAHGVEANGGGMQRMFMDVARTYLSKKDFINFSRNYGIKEVDVEQLVNLTAWRDDDVKKWDLMQFQVYMIANFQYYIMSYKWSKNMTEDEYNWLYMFVSLCLIDTTVVTDMGFGPELFRRILASGLFLTASGGSKTHDSINHAYQFRQHETAHRVYNYMKTAKIPKDDFIILGKSYHAFVLANGFESYSDDCLLFMWRYGIPWATLTNRTAYLARNYLLALKVQKRKWRSEVGAKELEVMLKYLPRLADLAPDTVPRAEFEEPMNGASPSFLFKPYEENCHDWYPLTSKMEEDETGIKAKGINFLKFYFTDIKDGITNRWHIVPVRPPGDLVPKIYYSTHKYNHAQMLIKLQQYAYYVCWYPEMFQKFKKIHDLIKERYLVSYIDMMREAGFFERFVERKFGFTLGMLTKDYPDINACRAFFFYKNPPDPNTVKSIRQRVLLASYRSYDYVVWDLIRNNVIGYDIGGKYPRPLGSNKLAQDDRRRQKAHLYPIDDSHLVVEDFYYNGRKIADIIDERNRAL